MNNFLEINIKNILNNLEILKKANPKKQICIPVKANAYGVGYEVAKILIKNGYEFFAVSTLEEAIYIRKMSKKAKILLFSAVFEEDIELIKKNQIIITVYDFKMLSFIDSDVNFHIKFDVGMGRLGFRSSEINKIKKILKQKKLKPVGIYTHLPNSENELKSYKQIKKFEEIVKKLKEFEIKYIHYANGVAALKYKTTFDNLIRPGLVVYGYFESLELKNKICKDIKPSCDLKIRCSYIKDYEGEIGYGGMDFIKGQVATFSLGHHDGLRQTYRGYEIKDVGKIVGKICMCQFMVLLKTKNKIKKGDYIYILKGDEIYSLSQHSKVSVYEILATLGPRIKREYIGEK